MAYSEPFLCSSFPPKYDLKIPLSNRGQGDTNTSAEHILPLENLLQGFPSEGIAVLEDIVEGMQGTQLPTLLLMVNMQWWWLRWLWRFRFGLVTFPWHATHFLAGWMESRW